jgi:hypothetical protein
LNSFAPKNSLIGRHSLGNTLSGGFEPGGLIERMKAMIFQSWSRGLDGCTHWRHWSVHSAVGQARIAFFFQIHGAQCYEPKQHITKNVAALSLNRSTDAIGA